LLSRAPALLLLVAWAVPSSVASSTCSRVTALVHGRKDDRPILGDQVAADESESAVLIVPGIKVSPLCQATIVVTWPSNLSPRLGTDFAVVVEPVGRFTGA